MSEEVEKNVTELSPRVNVTEWMPCVVSNGMWEITDSVNKGDRIYRIFNDKIDIKARMIVKSLGYYVISVHLIDQGIDILNIELDDALRVCKTSAETDPGTFVMKRELHFNEELKPGCLYRIVDSSLTFQYLMYIRHLNAECIDADIMKPILVPEETISKYSVIEAKHELVSRIDLKDMMFNQIALGKGCNFKIE